MPKRILTARELADQLRLKESTIRKWAKRGLIPVIKPTAKVIRFDGGDVVAALKQRTKELASAAQKRRERLPVRA